MIELFTLPTCPICDMVKKKLNAKNIPFVERSFDELPESLSTDRAPVLYNEDIYLLSPTEINEWIKGV
jgi:glutaredoxin